jgi:hypothetical protein
MKAGKFPVTITEKGVSAIIRKSTKLKGGKTHKYFIVEDILLGKRKQVWRSTLDEANAVASEACSKIANGDQSALELKDTDRMPQGQTTDASFGVLSNQFGFNINWASGQTVVVEVCTNLNNWKPMQTNTLTSGSIYFSDAQWTNYPARFDRLRAP